MTDSEIENQIKQIIFKHFSPPDYKIFVYGSRAGGKPRRYSDWDIGILGDKPVSPYKLNMVKEKLEDSDLPVVVDVVDFNDVGAEFRQIALRNTKPWIN